MPFDVTLDAYGFLQYGDLMTKGRRKIVTEDDHDTI